MDTDAVQYGLFHLKLCNRPASPCRVHFYWVLIWFICLCHQRWLVWQEHNSRTFEDKERTLNHLKSLLFGSLFLWARIWGCTNCISLSEFLASCSFSSWLFFYLFLAQSVHYREHDVQFFQYKVLLPIKKKKKKMGFPQFILPATF